MSAFTRLGSLIWDWEPWTELPAPARILWLALYTSAEAKRHVPGLWQGGIPMMADAARMRADDVVEALDKLLERDLVEYDPRTRVLRLCELPDAGEYPANGKVLLSWWTRFNTVPACAVRDAHVRTIAWILDEGGKRSGKTVTDHHREAWALTFARIVLPAPRRRGVRRLAESDTSTAAQPSLFSSSAISVPSGNGIGDGREQIPFTGYPQSVDKSAMMQQSNVFAGPETVSDTVSDTNRIPDPGSRIPDPSGSSGSGMQAPGDHVRGGAVLALVPQEAGVYGVDEVLRELARGPWDSSSDSAYSAALAALIPAWAAAGVTLLDFKHLGQLNANSNRRWSMRVLLVCDIQAEVAAARRMLAWSEVRGLGSP